MVKNKDRWSALSIKDRADLINMYITNGIRELTEMKKHYNGIPYRDLNTSDYDYFNAASEMAPTEEGQHWDSRNPHTGRLLKGENHPTFDLMVEGENKAGYKIVRGYNGELYSIPNTPDNYVENYNSFGDGGDKDTWYKRLYNWVFNDNNTEETVPQENKYLTNDNYLNEVSKFISTFEEFYPDAYEDTHNGKNIWTVGSGLTYLLDDEGNEIKVKKGDTITKEENINQLNKRLQKNIDYVKSKTQYWDNYPAELKFQLLDAMYNIGTSKVWNPETNYIKAIRQYENEKGWENPEYDLKNIFQHADWNLNNKGWLGIRSIMRRNPQSINAEDFSKIYQNNYRDSLRTAYDIKFQNN